MNKETEPKKGTEKLLNDIFYNTFGTFFYFFCQWLMTVLVVRLSGYEDAGILSLVISTTNIFYFISLFGVRNYQISDIERKFSDNDYLSTRIISTFLSLLSFLIVFCFLGFDEKTLTCSIFYLLFKFAESFSDVYFGFFQKYKNYKAIAFSYTLKGIITVTVFSFSLVITKSLLLSIISMFVSYVIAMMVYDFPIIKRLFKFKFQSFNVSVLLVHCAPLMFSALVLPYLNFITRYAISKSYSATVLGFYSSISMVFVLLSTLMGSVFISIMPKLALLYHDNNTKSLKRLLSITSVVILLLGILTCILASMLGDFVFSLLFGKEIVDYIYLLVPTVIASIALVFVSFYSSALISFKKNRLVLFLNLISAILCSITIFPFLSAFDLMGAIISLIFSLIVTSLLLVFATYRVINNTLLSL